MHIDVMFSISPYAVPPPHTVYLYYVIYGMMLSLSEKLILSLIYYGVNDMLQCILHIRINEIITHLHGKHCIASH